jgi:phage terminase large subunit-like protein
MSTATAPPPFRERLPNGEIKINLHAGQAAVWNSRRRFIIMSGSTQVGKTCFGPHWLDREINGDANYPGRGPGDYLAVTATYPLLKLKMLPEFLYVFRDLERLGTWKESDRVFASHDRLHGAEAWRVIFGSATNPESIESATAKAAWLDELGQHQFKREAWDAVVRRLTLSEGRVLGTTTLYELGWLKTELYDRWKAGDTSIDWIEVDALSNPVACQRLTMRPSLRSYQRGRPS